MTKKSAQAKIDLCWHLLMFMAICLVASAFPDAVFAGEGGDGGQPSGDSNAIEQVFCNVIQLMTGTTGKAIATVAIIAVGIGALLGKISWGMALIVALGVALVFGAGSIVDALGASATTCTSGGSIANDGTIGGR